MLLVPKPVVAAINGHAIAGGCMLALACDRRIMSEGRIGVPELLVGVPFPTLPLELVRRAVAPHVFKDLVYSGRTLPAGEAKDVGLVDEVAPSPELIARSCEAAERLARIPGETFRITKAQMSAPILESMRAHEDTDRRVLEAWKSEACRAAIRDYVDRTIKKGK